MHSPYARDPNDLRFGPIQPLESTTCKLCRIFWCAVASWVVVRVAARLLGWW
jgi:hypothetical protein